MAGGREVRAGKAFVELSLRDRLQSGLRRAAARLRSFATVTSAMGAGLAGVGTAVLGPIAAATNQFASAGDIVQKMAARTGLSAEAVSELGHAANLSGTNLATLETGVRRMQQTIGDAAAGVKMSADALARLGLFVADLVSLSPDEQLALLADRIARIENPALRTATAVDIFGRSGTQLLPMLAGGAAGLQSMRDQARALGLTISTDAANSAAALTDALGTMWSAVKALTINIGGALAPILTDVADRMTAVVASVVKFIQSNQRLVVIVAGVASAVAASGAALLGIGGMAAIAALTLSGLASAMGFAGAMLTGIGAAISTVLSPIGLLAAGVGVAAGAWLHFSGVGRRALEFVRQQFAQMLVFLKSIVGGMANALMAGDLTLAARILWAGVRVAFFQGVDALSAAWTTLISNARQVWHSIAGGAQSAVNSVMSAMGTMGQWIGQLVSSVAGGLGTIFADVQAAVGETLAAIGAALAQGDLALAAEILWLSIKLAFQEGIAAVTLAWAEFTTGLAAVFDRLVTTIRTMWNNVSSWIAAQLLRLVGAVRSALESLEQFDPTGLASKLKASLELDVEQAVRFVEQDRERFNQQLDASRQQRDDGRVQAMRERMAATERQLADLRQGRDAVMTRADATEGDTSGSQLENARTELEKLLSEAARLPKLFDAQAAQSELDMSGENLDSLFSQVASEGKVSTQGTFNAAATFGLATGGVEQRTMKAAETTAGNTRRLVDLARRNRMVFG